MDKDKKLVASWWFWCVLLIVVTIPIFWILSAVGIIGKTVVEREVFERSFQYSEAREESRIIKPDLATIIRVAA
jgi:hypothetical protein